MQSDGRRADTAGDGEVAAGGDGGGDEEEAVEEGGSHEEVVVGLLGADVGMSGHEDVNRHAARPPL